MTVEETSALLALCTTYWPEIGKQSDPLAMAKAWALALADIPQQQAQAAVVELARTLKFAPRVAEIRDTVERLKANKREYASFQQSLVELGILTEEQAKRRIDRYDPRGKLTSGALVGRNLLPDGRELRG